MFAIVQQKLCLLFEYRNDCSHREFFYIEGKCLSKTPYKM